MLERLFEQIKIGSLVLPNRIIFPAISTNYSVDTYDRSLQFYAERAMGGAGLIIIGALQAIYPGRRVDGNMTINKDEDIPHLQKMTKAVHDNGGKVAAQLAVWNLWAKGGIGAATEDVSPSGVATMSQLPQFKQSQFISESRPLTIEEIGMIEKDLAASAARAVAAGFDAIELQAIGGNLIHRFINPHTNQRTDRYGGNLENRLRMFTETIALIKARVGDDFPFICRIAGEDMVPWGQDLNDYKEIAPLLEKTGVHALDIMPGWYETRLPRHQMSVPRGAFVYLAEGIKQVVTIPVAVGNRISDPKLAEQIIAQGKADLVTLCRPLVADPDLPNKAKEGRLDEIRRCVGCCQCWDSVGAGNALACSVNFRAGREGEFPLVPAPVPKKVLVVGGGPAGMEAARVAALRGHDVTLFEKSDRLGGQLRFAVLPPFKKEWQTTIDYLSTQLSKLGVRVRLAEAVTPETIEKEKPDAVVVATGALPIVPEIPGIKGENVATALDVLTGKKTTGDQVVVVGGGAIGCETAEFLHRQGKRITIVEMMSAVADDIGQWTRWPMMDRLEEAQIKIEVNLKVEKITAQGIYASREGKTEFIAADTVVIAVGMKSDDRLSNALEGKVASLYAIGCCVIPGRVVNAIEEGFRAGYQV